jgi:hypothetical protein
MTGSSTPLTDQPDWHPVHRANAMLRAALLNSTFSPERLAAIEEADPPSLFDDAIELARDPGARTYQLSFIDAADALTLSLDDEDAAPPIEASEARGPSPQARVQALVHDFHRRQRQISVFVALCLAAAFVLTLAGFVLVASLTASATPEDAPAPIAPAKSPVDEKDWAPLRSTSVAWQPPMTERVSHGAPQAAQTILARAGRKVALAPLLPQHKARYLLLRGLPSEATLSAGKKSASGAWMVKDADVQYLTLRVGSARGGDYPVEVYLLESAAGPPARHNFVLRVDTAPRIYTAGLDTSWTTALLDMAFFRGADETPASTPPAPADLLSRAKQLLAEGDIAGARLLLQHLAERGQGEAAYEFARTFDRDMLAALGASSIDGDLERARRWYALASQKGSEKAAERLQILASLSGRTPSD